MKLLNVQETNLVSGASFNTDFDLNLAAYEGAMSGIVGGMPLALMLGGGIAYSVGRPDAPNASYFAAASVAFLSYMACVGTTTIAEMGLAYFEIPVNYIFY